MYHGAYGEKKPQAAPRDDGLLDLALSGASAVLGSCLETVKWGSLGSLKAVRKGIVGRRKLIFLSVPPELRRHFREAVCRPACRVEMRDETLIFQAAASGDVRDVLNAVESLRQRPAEQSDFPHTNLTVVLRSRLAPRFGVLSYQQPKLTAGQEYDIRVIEWIQHVSREPASYFAVGYLNGLRVEIAPNDQRNGWDCPTNAPFALGDYVRCTVVTHTPSFVYGSCNAKLSPNKVRLHPPEYRVAYILASNALYIEAHLVDLPNFGPVACVDYIATPQDFGNSRYRQVRFDLALRSRSRIGAKHIACLSANRMHAMISECPEDYPPLVEIARNAESNHARFVGRAGHTLAMSFGRFRRNTQQCIRFQNQCLSQSRPIAAATVARFVYIDSDCIKNNATWPTLNDQKILIKQVLSPGVYHLLFCGDPTPDRSGKLLARAVAVTPTALRECIALVNGTAELFRKAHEAADIRHASGKEMTKRHQFRSKTVGRFLSHLKNQLHLSRQVQLRETSLVVTEIKRRKTDARNGWFTCSIDRNPLDSFKVGDMVRLLRDDFTQLRERAHVARIGRSSISFKGVKSLDDAKYFCTDVDDAPYRIQLTALDRISLDSSRTNYARRILTSLRSRHNYSWRSRQALRLFDERIQTNAPMIAALHSALRPNQNLLAVQGPPGTGKTTFIVELVRQLVEMQGAKVLVTSQSNLAVDEVLARLARTSSTCTTVRLGAVEKLLDEVKPMHFALDDADAWDRLRGRVTGKKAALAWSGQFLRRMTSIARDIVSAQTLQKATGSPIAAALEWVDVVGATCVGIGTGRAMPFSQATYDVVIIDEASRATTAETLIPMRLGRRCVIVGDHKQLPPTVDQNICKELTRLGESAESLKASLFEQFQLGGDKDHIPLVLPLRKRVLLNTQFRMHPEIASFVSDVFYAPDQEALVSHESTNARGFKAGVFSNAISVINTQRYPRTNKEQIPRMPLNREDRVGTGTSCQNELEAWLVQHALCILRDELRASGKTERYSIGIITPYAAQVLLLRRKLRALSSLSPLEMEDDSISTVDAFQGKEKDIIILSFVRSIDTERVSLAFLKDLRRINVACSRARHKLILVGDGATLRKADRGILHEHNRHVYERLLTSFKKGGVAGHVWWKPEMVVGQSQTAT